MKEGGWGLDTEVLNQMSWRRPWLDTGTAATGGRIVWIQKSRGGRIVWIQTSRRKAW